MTSLLLLATVRQLLDWAGAWLRDTRGRAVARREFHALDSATLRDLGLGPSEFDSLWAEGNGSAQRTRRRVAIRRHGHTSDLGRNCTPCCSTPPSSGRNS